MARAARSTSGWLSRRTGRGRSEMSSAQVTVAPPAGAGSTRTSAQPSSTRPTLSIENRPRPCSVGGSQRVSTMASAKPRGPMPLMPAHPQPTRGSPGSTRMVVIGIHR